MTLDFSYSRIPRQTIGHYITRRHYSSHIISISLYLGKGHKIDLTVMDYGRSEIRFYNYNK